MLVTKEIEIDMGHRIPNHESKCRNFHGHRYKIACTVEGLTKKSPGTSDEGMVIDFTDLKEAMISVIDKPLDHGFMIYREDPHYPYFKKCRQIGMKIIAVDFIPTAENFAKYIFDRLSFELDVYYKMVLKEVTVWETPTSSAIYRGEGDEAE